MAKGPRDCKRCGERIRGRVGARRLYCRKCKKANDAERFRARYWSDEAWRVEKRAQVAYCKAMRGKRTLEPEPAEPSPFRLRVRAMLAQIDAGQEMTA
jgi:hypothetical protein